MALADRISFKVNGEEHSVGCEVSSDVMLVDYIRDWLELRGTKYMCRAGGCGVCSVSVRKHPGGPMIVVNSCMVCITSCKDWEITTIEELGNRKKGYHVLQKTLADYNGTQCGYCSPAWVQNMNCLLQKDVKPSMLEVETAFAGSICRCTGYRPIADAFKKFAIDAPKEHKITDIEDLRICKRTGLSCNKNKCDDEDDWCIVSNEEVKGSQVIEIRMEDDKFWYTVNDLQSIFNVLDAKGYDSYMLVYGNTAKGVYGMPDYKVMIDISTVPELKTCTLDQNLIVGVGITLNEFLDICKASGTGYFKYLQKFVEHINLVASIPIRNLGSVAGNLMIKHQHNEFPSDIFLLFVTVGAYLEFCTSTGVRKKVSMEQFLKEDMKGKVLVNVILPPLNEQYVLETFKIMPRSQNVHAYVNAGFLYKLSTDNTVLEARIAYGNLSPAFIRAGATEKFLIEKQLFINSTLQSGLKILESELVVDEAPPNPSVKFRKQLALSLFYKGLMSLCPKEILNPRYLSGSSKIHETRPVSSGQQVFETNESLWPLNKPIPKIEALIQCAGETKYTDDLPAQPREVHAAFVLSTVAVGYIVNIDATKALSHPRVIALYTADDIPGTNSFSPKGEVFYPNDEELLSSGKVSYYNQPIAIIVAETQQIANKAASMVTATYKNVQVPVMDVQDAKNDASRTTPVFSSPATEKGADVVKTIKGQFNTYGQLHVPMELMSCVTLPTEEGLEVHATTQWTDGCQIVISRALGIDANWHDKLNEPLSTLAADVYNNCYTETKWNYALYDVITDTAKTTWCRTPATLESIATAEYILERISYELLLDPFDVRIANVDTTKYNAMIEIAENLKKTSSYNERKDLVATFNKNNRWKKRGLRVSFMRWTPSGISIFDVNMSVCHSDGTVMITHGGIEMGQGMNTKAVQICAYLLKIPIDKIQIKGNNTIIAPNCFITGASLGSQNVGLGVGRCCEALLERLQPIRDRMTNPTWLELILEAYDSDVDLQTHSYVKSTDQFSMDIYGAAVGEVEIDVLTGELEVIRVDILEDVGQSVSPEIDVGQVEGAFMMGQGYWTCENLVYDKKTGELLTDSTWDYHVPLLRDIPQDFRVTFRKNSYSYDNIFGSKCVGEPPMCLSVVVAFAIREAIAAARTESGIPTNVWFDINGPFTLEQINLACSVQKEHFMFN